MNEERKVFIVSWDEKFFLESVSTETSQKNLIVCADSKEEAIEEAIRKSANAFYEMVNIVATELTPEEIEECELDEEDTIYYPYNPFTGEEIKDEIVMSGIHIIKKPR